MEHLKITYKDECTKFAKTSVNKYPIRLFSNYTKKITIGFSDSYNLIVPNSMQQIFFSGLYKKKEFYIQPTNILKIRIFNGVIIKYDYSFSKHKNKHIMANIIFQHALKFNKTILHTKNIFLIEHLNRCNHDMIHCDNILNMIIFKNIKKVITYCEYSCIFVVISILKNAYELSLNFDGNDEQHVFNLNCLCNVFKLNIECCSKITNTCRIIKNYKLKLYECNNIFCELNANKFIFSYIVNLIMLMYETQNYMSVKNKENIINVMNLTKTVRTLQIGENKYLENIPSFTYDDLMKIK